MLIIAIVIIVINSVIFLPGKFIAWRKGHSSGYCVACDLNDISLRALAIYDGLKTVSSCLSGYMLITLHVQLCKAQ